jgi:hypothetical protein
MQYMNWQRRPQGLDRLGCLSKEHGLTLTTPDGRQYLLDDVIIDSGANILLLMEEFYIPQGDRPALHCQL